METNLHSTISGFRDDDANCKALLDSEYLSRSFRMLFFGSILLLNEGNNSDQLTVGALNWTAAEPLQDYHLSLVGYKFAGFFFYQKNTLSGLDHGFPCSFGNYKKPWSNLDLFWGLGPRAAFEP